MSMLSASESDYELLFKKIFNELDETIKRFERAFDFIFTPNTSNPAFFVRALFIF
jgi:hypothetical protein